MSLLVVLNKDEHLIMIVEFLVLNGVVYALLNLWFEERCWKILELACLLFETKFLRLCMLRKMIKAFCWNV